MTKWEKVRGWDLVGIGVVFVLGAGAAYRWAPGEEIAPGSLFFIGLCSIALGLIERYRQSERRP